jgi:hypothetical protein
MISGESVLNVKHTLYFELKLSLAVFVDATNIR